MYYSRPATVHYYTVQVPGYYDYANRYTVTCADYPLPLYYAEQVEYNRWCPLGNGYVYIKPGHVASAKPKSRLQAAVSNTALKLRYTASTPQFIQ